MPFIFWINILCLSLSLFLSNIAHVCLLGVFSTMWWASYIYFHICSSVPSRLAISFTVSAISLFIPIELTIKERSSSKEDKYFANSEEGWGILCLLQCKLFLSGSMSLLTYGSRGKIDGRKDLRTFGPYMQKTCDVAEKAILAKKKLRKKCVNRDKM